MQECIEDILRAMRCSRLRLGVWRERWPTGAACWSSTVRLKVAKQDERQLMDGRVS